MSLMQAQRQGEKYPNSTLLKSSNELGWSTLLAELRSHNRYEGPGDAALMDADVGVVVRGSDEGLLTFKFAGSWQSTRPTTGSIHLMPIGRTCDEARIGSANLQVLHLYVPAGVFTGLMDDYNLPAVPGRSIRYSCGVQDELINQIGLSVLSEMMSPTAAGRMLVETSSRLLAARLGHAHAETELIRLPIPTSHRLDAAHAWSGPIGEPGPPPPQERSKQQQARWRQALPSTLNQVSNRVKAGHGGAAADEAPILISTERNSGNHVKSGPG